MTDEEAERQDAVESLAWARQHLIRCRDALHAQINRSTAVYGARRQWPASSEVTFRRLNADLVAARISVREYERLLADDEQFSTSGHGDRATRGESK